MARKTVVDYDFSEKEIKKRRTFPIGRLIAFILLIIVQLFLLILMISVDITPDDKIDSYEIYVVPQDNGSLDIEYKFRWTPLKENEPLTWIYIGIPNPEYTVLEYSDNVRSIEKYYDDYNMCNLVVNFVNGYNANDTFEFSVKINQKYMLCQKNGNLFYEFVPCWFNRIPVESYSFNWYDNGKISSSNSATKNGEWLTWTGSMEAGEYRMLTVNYSEFNAPTVRYERFNNDGVDNALKSDRSALVFACVFFILLCLIAEIFIYDCFISYRRGRGFIRGYGHPMYIYGRSNPKYQRAASRHSGSRSGGFSGGGCACACACACAGGGRAGCSQKDTYKSNSKDN